MFVSPGTLFLLVLDLSRYTVGTKGDPESSCEGLVLRWVRALQVLTRTCSSVNE